MGKHVCTVVYILSRAQSECLQNLGCNSRLWQPQPCPVELCFILLYNNRLPSWFVGIRTGLVTPILQLGTEGKQV